VAKFRFSRRAEADLLSIADYTLREWGKAQTARYIDELEDCCQMLADNPALDNVALLVPAVLVPFGPNFSLEIALGGAD
jgi:plasmid stabilization system protein ParE